MGGMQMIGGWTLRAGLLGAQLCRMMMAGNSTRSQRGTRKRRTIASNRGKLGTSSASWWWRARSRPR